MIRKRPCAPTYRSATTHHLEILSQSGILTLAFFSVTGCILRAYFLMVCVYGDDEPMGTFVDKK